jgi:hypothetical protein
MALLDRARLSLVLGPQPEPMKSPERVGRISDSVIRHLTFFLSADYAFG